MEKEVLKNHHPHTSSTTTISTSTSLRERHITGEGLCKSSQSADFVLQWGNRKRLRFMKMQGKNETSSVTRTTVRVDRRVIRSNDNVAGSSNGGTTGHFNLRQRSASPAQPPARNLRNTETVSGMKGPHNNNVNHHSNNNHQSNGVAKGLTSPDKGEKKGGTHDNIVINGGGRAGSSSETKNGCSSGAVSDLVWPPKFMIALTNKEKEEDFMAIKGSKLPQRPKKRAKFIQRSLNLVSPGGWLCDLTLERYEVREKKISKKRPRGLKAMGNYMESDSE